MQNQTNELIRAIHEGIEKRGFFLLLESRLLQIGLHDQHPALDSLAKNHGWKLKRENGGVLFCKQGAPFSGQFTKFFSFLADSGESSPPPCAGS